MSFRSSEQLVHADGRPFAEAKAANPPCPGGTWPGVRVDAPSKPIAPVLELVSTNLDTPKKRFDAMISLLESGYMAPANSGKAAEAIVGLAWNRIQGIALSEKDSDELADHLEKIRRHNMAFAEAAKAYQAAERLKKLRADRDTAAAGLERRRAALDTATAFVSNAADELDSLFLSQE